jgi:hypothetical protein
VIADRRSNGLRILIPIDRGQHSDDRGQFPCRHFNGSGVGRVKLVSLAGFFRWFAQGLAVEPDGVRGVHKAVEDGIAWPGILVWRQLRLCLASFARPSDHAVSTEL